MENPIAIMSALEAEGRSLVDAMTDRVSVEVGPMRGYVGVLDGRKVVMVRAGLGKVSTATAVGLLHERFRPNVFAFSGVAGGLSPDLHIGDVVIGAVTLQHDAGVIEAGGLHRYQAGHIPFFNPTEEFGYTPSPELLENVRTVVDGGIELQDVLNRVPRVVMGTILTGDQYLHDEVTREALHTELGGEAIEMEGAAMAQAATLVGADHLVVRSLSDLAGSDSISDFGRFLDEVSVNSARVVRALLPVL
jgi:adenosylhomocysteine nucleosidase